ncbi:hypothetical protein ACEPAI_1428 [Sanghuangporus weigelae]
MLSGFSFALSTWCCVAIAQPVTATLPWIRIGADSADHTDFNQHIKYVETIFPDPSAPIPYPEASNITVGAKYYTLASHLPPGTHVIWGVNFGSDNVTAAFLEARAIKTAFDSDTLAGKSITLEAIEIGNEPDIYGFTGHRDPATWTIEEYVKEWTTFAKNVAIAAGRRWSILCGGGVFLWDSKFFRRSLINQISQHRYSGNVGATASIPSLMSKATIRANLSLLINDINVVHAKELGYILGETNNYFEHGEPGVSNTAGAAIRIIDYTLYAASINIDDVSGLIWAGQSFETEDCWPIGAAVTETLNVVNQSITTSISATEAILLTPGLQ